MGTGRAREFPFPRGRRGSRSRKAGRRLRAGEAGRLASAAGVAPSPGRDRLSPPGSEEGVAQALAWAVAPIPVRGQRGWPRRGDTHRHGGARGRREQRAGGWKGLSGPAPRRGNPAAAAAAPLGRPQPFLRPFPFPALPRPLPSAHKTFFFFFKLPGRTRAGQWAAGNQGQTAAGAADGPMGARAGPGAGPAATGRELWGGRARRMGAGGGEGRAPAAGRREEGRT